MEEVKTNLNETIGAASRHLEDLVFQNTSHVDAELLDKVVAILESTVVLDKQLIVPALLPKLAQVVQLPLDDYTAVVKLLGKILERLKFQETLEYVNVDQFAAALVEGSKEIQLMGVKHIETCDPPDLVANTILIELLLRLALNESDGFDVANASIHAVVVLAKADLVRRRLFTDPSCVGQLKEVFHGNNGILQSRLMEIVAETIPFDTETNYIPLYLLAYPPDTLCDMSDVLAVVAKVQFYSKLLPSISSNDIIVEELLPQFDAIAQLYARMKDDPEIRMFLGNDIFEFLGALSKYRPQAFAAFDQDIGIVGRIDNYSDDGIVFLSLLDPGYLVENRPEIISTIRIKAKTVRAVRKFVLHQGAYSLLRLDADKVLELPLLEIMVMIGALASTNWGRHDLLTQRPKLMTKLLENEDINDLDVLAFRRQAIEKLLDRPPAELGPWLGGLKELYRRIIYGEGSKTAPGVRITDETGQ
ncbi:DNA mismatch repair protein Hsm3p [Trichomonascus vanleenenianus]|uniref:Hsm3p n=1 Tax=Trichomonascus vanleenenianus TaxID=2268995 RepID=UPI003EC985F3